MLQTQLSHLKSRRLDRSQIEASYTRIFYVWLCLVLFCEHVYSHNFYKFWLFSQSVGRSSVKLLMAFSSTAIPGFSLLVIHGQVLYSLLDMYVFRKGASFLTKEGSVSLCWRFVAPQFQHEYIRAVTASRSLWTLHPCHCSILSNIRTMYTEVSCRCRLVQQVMSWIM
jgi:hypothetical protein